MSEREEYLDELLKEIGSDSEVQTTEEELVDGYDKKLEGIDENDFLREFEKSLGEEVDFDMEMELSTDTSAESELESELGLYDNEEGSGDFMDNIDYIVNNVKNGNLDDSLGDGDLSIEESLKNYDEEDPVLDEIGQMFALDSSDMVNTLDEPEEELSEAERLAREIEGLNLEVEEKPRSKNTKAETVEETVAPEPAAEKKKGFFSRLSAALFGEEEEVVEEKPKKAGIESIENISEENLDALLEMENQKSPEEEEAAKKQQEKEEKKALKEQKAKEKAEKKAEKKALKEQKAKAKAEQKAAKKSQQPVVKSKPLPKKPVALIILLGLSIVLLINLLSNLSGYRTALADAKEYYEKGNYVEAYGCLSEKDMKEADYEFYEKVRLTAYLQQQLTSYKVYQGQNMYNEALSALVCGVGRYDRFIAEAESYGVEREYDKLLQEMTDDLSNSYQVSLEQARQIYALEDKREYSLAIQGVTKSLGLLEEP